MQHFLEVLKILDGAVNADRNKVLAYAEQLAAKLEANGDPRSAEGIRRTVRKGRTRDLEASRMTSALPVDGESRLALADERSYAAGEVRIVFDASSAERVAEFVRNIRGSAELMAGGVNLSPSLLMYGPPGCGKTEIAKYVAAQLDLPLLTARTDSLISSYLGSTAKNLRLLFEHAMSRPCVLFLDEFDAVAKLRDDQHELGELKRVVVSLLQNIDALDSNTVLVAATNHEHLLDRAIWRRFAFRLQIGLPTLVARRTLLEQFLAGQAPPAIPLEDLAIATEGMSGADIRTLCEEARRTAILNRQTGITDRDLLLRLARNRIADLDTLSTRDQLASARRLSPKLFTVRRLADLFSVSTGKVSTLLRKEGTT